MEKIKTCSCPDHSSYGSIYKADQVPLKLFFKDPENPIGKEFSTCSDCRNYKALAEKRRREKHLKNYNDVVNSDSEYKYCASAIHSKTVSRFPRDKVPANMFVNEEKGIVLKSCSDCRVESNKTRIATYERLKLFLKNNPELIYCFDCHKFFENRESMHIRADGNVSTRCLICKQSTSCRNRKKYDEKKQWYYDIKLNFFKQYENCCQRCDKIFIKPIEGSLIVRELTPFYIDKIKMINFDDKTYKVSDFLTSFTELLELRIIQLDHLSENEQRARGILKKEEKYEEKKFDTGSENRYKNKKEIENESKKCQHLCCKCHIIVTKERELNVENRNLITKTKRRYVDKIKENGCSECGFKDVALLRFFDMDHLNPEDKIDCVSHMVLFTEYTLEDVTQECKKCRVLCKHCHIIHTSNQIKNQII